MGDVVILDERPQCDICGDPAEYDARTMMGILAYLCEYHWHAIGCGKLGTGCGQRIRIGEKN